MALFSAAVLLAPGETNLDSFPEAKVYNASGKRNMCHGHTCTQEENETHSHSLKPLLCVCVALRSAVVDRVSAGAKAPGEGLRGSSTQPAYERSHY